MSRPATKRTGIWKRLAVLLLSGVLGLMLVVILALGSPSVRESILVTTIDRVATALPATLRVERARWPALGTIALERVSLRSDEDTLVSMQKIDLVVRLSGLFRRELMIDSVHVAGLTLDLPRLRAAFPATPVDAADDARSEGSIPIPLRPGAFASLPSGVVRSLTISGDRIDLGEGNGIADFRIRAALDNSAEGAPEFVVHEMQMHDPNGTWRVGEVLLHAKRGSPLALDAALHVAPKNRLTLTVREESDGSFQLSLRETGDDRVADPALQGRVTWADLQASTPIRFTFDGQIPSTNELRSYAAVAPFLATLPEREGAPFTIQGYWISKDGSGDADVTIGPGGGIDKAEAHVSWGRDRVDLDRFAIRADDLEAEGTFALHQGNARGRLRVDLGGSRGLGALLGPGGDPFPSVQGEVVVETAGPIDSMTTTATLLLHAFESAPAIRQFSAEVRHARADGSIRATLVLETDHVRLDLAALSDESLAQIDIGPVRILESESPGPGRPEIGSSPGSVRFDRERGSVAVSSLRWTGDFGRGTADGTASPDSGSIRLRTDWNVAPPALVRRIEPTVRDTLQNRWPAGSPYQLSGALTFARGESGLRARAGFDFALPGPGVIAPALPREAGRRLAGKIALDGTGLDAEQQITALITVGPDGWIDSMAVSVSRSGEMFAIDTAFVALRGLTVHTAGTVEHDSLRLHGSYDITPEILDFVPDSTRVDSLRANGDFRIAGTASAPDASLSIAGIAHGPSFDLDTIDGGILLRGGAIEANFRTGGRAAAGPIVLDHASVNWRGGSVSPWLPGELSIETKGPALDFALDAACDRAGDTLLVAGSALQLDYEGRTLGTASPFDIRFDPATSHLEVRGFDLAGTLGSLRADGTAGHDDMDLSLSASLAIPESFALDLPVGMVPDRVEVEARVSGSERLELTASAEGLDLGTRQNVNVDLQIDGTDSGLVARIAGIDAGGALFEIEATVPVVARFQPPGFTQSDGLLDIEARFDGLPLPLPARKGSQNEWAALTGRLTASARDSLPEFNGEAVVTFPGVLNLSDYRVALEARSLGAVGTELKFDVDEDGRPLAEAILRDPTRITLHPFRVERDSSGTLFLDMQTKDLRLEDFNRWFPANTSIAGDLRIALKAEGPVGNPSLQGMFTSKQLNLKLADQSTLRARGELSLSGNRQTPQVRGEAIIDRGVLRIPEEAKHLLPATGDARLWEVPDFAEFAPSETDSSRAAVATTAPLGAVDPDVEVTLSIPSGLWLRGQGLDVELSGHLSLGYQNGAPSVIGALRADRGQFILLGRTFRMDSGMIVFYGDEEVNPVLDIRLSINLEGTLVNLNVGGTMLDPQLFLSSEPEMPEGDILSFLLFGRPLEDLNDNQMDLVQRRAADIVTAFGTGQLEAKLAGQLGVDLVRIRETRGETKGKSLVLGKYVSRKVLLEYEQALESNVFFISLDYFLTRHFRLRTLYGQSDQSGMEVNWFNEY